MTFRRLSLSHPAPIALCLFSLLCQIHALTVEYCSNLNTASGDPTYWQYQSNGWCHDHCVSDYAFAIVQDFNCWCSNYAPGASSSSSNCNTKCPGYNEFCGGQGFYGYIALDVAPSGTMLASGAAASSTSAQQVTVTASGVPVTILSTVAPTSLQTSSTSSSNLLQPSSNPTSDPNPDSTSMTWIPTPITSVETLTGQVRTVTITPTAPPTAGDNSGTFEQVTSHGLSIGQAVGLTVGLVALIGILGAVIFFCIRKRRQTTSGDQFDDIVRGDSSSGQVPKRTMSEVSRYMLGTDGRQVVEGWEPETVEVAGSRRSRLIPVDPRLDPFAPVYQRGDGSKSRESVATIRDDHDYSRRFHNGRPILRATNPDE